MICAGDKVKILNENAEGIVKKIISEKFALVQVDDFEYEYSIHNLLKIEEENPESLIEKISSKEILSEIKDDIAEVESTAAGIRKIKLKKGKKSPLITEVDLHSSEIISDTSGMNSEEILNFQLNYFMNELENAVAKNEKQIIFIHGKGEGILRDEIHKILRAKNFIFYNAPLRFYGDGATLVEL